MVIKGQINCWLVELGYDDTHFSQLMSHTHGLLLILSSVIYHSWHGTKGKRVEFYLWSDSFFYFSIATFTLFRGTD